MKTLLSVLLLFLVSVCFGQTESLSGSPEQLDAALKSTKNKVEKIKSKIKKDSLSIPTETEKKIISIQEQLQKMSDPKWIEEQRNILIQLQTTMINTLLEAHKFKPDSSEVFYKPGWLLIRSKTK